MTVFSFAGNIEPISPVRDWDFLSQIQTHNVGISKLVQYSISHQISFKSINVKLTNNLLEITRYPIELPPRPDRHDSISLNKVRSKEVFQNSTSRARHNLFSMVCGNFQWYDKKITLTFKNTKKFNVKSLKDCDQRKVDFIQKLQKAFPNLKYLIVPELQKKSGRNAIHYHMVVNLPYMDFKSFKKFWTYGYFSINQIGSTPEQADYMSKYFSKDFSQPLGYRRYYASNNMTRPMKLYTQMADQALQEVKNQSLSPLIRKEYDWKCYGRIRYEAYILDQNGSIKKPPIAVASLRDKITINEKEKRE